MLYIISIGLHDIKDMSLKALERAKACDILYYESYTNFYKSKAEEIEELIGKKVLVAKRENIENESNKILEDAKRADVGILVRGDALTATTHIALMLEAKQKKINVEVVHGSSVLTAIAKTGISLYNLGKVTSIPFENEDVKVPLEVLKGNKDMHTLFLLDLRDEEKRYMTVNEAIKYLLKFRDKAFTEKTLCIGCCALGGKEIIKAGTAKELMHEEFKEFPQCLIVPGKMHFMEEAMVKSYIVK